MFQNYIGLSAEDTQSILTQKFKEIHGEKIYTTYSPDTAV